MSMPGHQQKHTLETRHGSLHGHVFHQITNPGARSAASEALHAALTISQSSFIPFAFLLAGSCGMQQSVDQQASSRPSRLRFFSRGKGTAPRYHRTRDGPFQPGRMASEIIGHRVVRDNVGLCASGRAHIITSCNLYKLSKFIFTSCLRASPTP